MGHEDGVPSEISGDDDDNTCGKMVKLENDKRENAESPLQQANLKDEDTPPEDKTTGRFGQ